jgi:hypothetical protein
MIRELAGAAVMMSIFSVTSGAVPLQCGGGGDPAPELQREDSPGDALWNLAEKFRGEHNDAAAKETLRYLVAQYPSNRHAGPAKDLLVQMGDVPPDGG